MIPYGRHYLDEDDIFAVAAQMRSGWLTQGPKVGEFEAAFADWVGAKYAVAVSNGTAGLHLACLAADVGSGDRVVTSPNSFVASANCAHYAGGAADFVDIERDSLNIDPAALREHFRGGARPKAVVPVHFAGLPCDLPALREAAPGAVIIEDAAHALGGSYRSGESVGSCAHSDMAVFSLHPVKSIASGEGGVITTNRADLYRRLLRLRSHGINKDDDPYLHPQNAFQDGVRNRWYYEMQELGFNFRLTDLQAALGLSQLGKLERFLERRRALASRYRALLPAGAPRGLRPAQSGGWGESANHLFVVRADFDGYPGGRTAFMQKLHDRGYITQVHYIPIPMQPFYSRLGHDMARLPECARYYREALSVPLFYGLSDADQDRFLADVLECLQ